MILGPFLALALAIGLGAQGERQPISEEDATALSITTSGSGSSRTVRVQISDTLTASEHDLPLPGVTHLRVPRGVVRLSCTRADQWCHDLTVDLSDGPRHVEVRVRPGLAVSGRLVDEAHRPATDRLRLQAQTFGPTRLSGKSETTETIRQTIDLQDGRFSTKLPAGRLDLRLAVPGFAPAYLWSLRAKGPRLDVGAVRLARGSSITGLVLDGPTGAPIAAATVAVTPLADHASQIDSERHRARTLDARTGQTGFFQLVGVRPGRYRIDVNAATRPRQDYGAVEVEDDSETHLGEIILRPPVRAGVQVIPVKDPVEGSWTVELAPLDARGREERLKERTDDQGRTTFEDLPAQSYRLRVSSSDGSRLVSRDEDFTETRDITVNVPLARVRGRVTLGDEPVPAGVVLESGNNDRCTLRSDASGAFEGWIRRPEKPFLLATVTAATPPINRTIDVTDIDPTADVIDLELEIPVTRVTGLVSDGEQPSPDVEVVARSSHMDITYGRTDRHGRFRLDGLGFGRHSLWASRGGSLTSTPETVELSSSTPAVEIQLLLPKGRGIEGRVISADGEPVAGADLLIQPLGAGDPERTVRTSVDGRFEVLAPSNTSRAHVQVQAPSDVLWSGCVELPAKEPLTITLPPLPGTEVRLRIPPDGTDNAPSVPTTAARPVLLSRSGGLVELQHAASWLRRLTGTFRAEMVTDSSGEGFLSYRFPGFAASDYAVAWSTEPWHALASRACAVGAPSGLTWAYGPPGGSVVLTLPDPPSRRQR